MTGNTSTSITDSPRNDGTTVQEPDWITIDTLPIGTYSTGDSFIVSGKASFPKNYEIHFGAYQSQFLTGSPDLLPPIYSGSTLVKAGTAGVNEWSFVVNTTQFRKTLRNGTIIQSEAIPGEYTLSIGPSGMVKYSFSLVEKNATPSEVSVPVRSDHSVNPTQSPLSTSAPIPMTISVMALVIVVSLLLRKRG